MFSSPSYVWTILSTATPSQPSALALDNIGATWARISWTAPLMADSPISRYEIIAREVDGSGVVTGTTTTTATFFNVTGLLPATTYMLTVVAISEGGDVIAKSPESESTTLTTRVTGISFKYRYQYNQVYFRLEVVTQDLGHETSLILSSLSRYIAT